MTMRFRGLCACALTLLWAGAHAQAPDIKRPARPAPKVTVKQGDKIRTGETASKPDKPDAGEGTFGESRTQGSLAPRPTQPTPTGQPPN